MAAAWFSSWFGYSQVRYTHHAEPITLNLKSGKQESLVELAESVTPPCRLNPWLFNGHLQTCWTAVKEVYDIPIYYKRRIFEHELEEYSGQFTVDFAVPAYEAPVDETLPPRTTYLTEEEFAGLGKRPVSTEEAGVKDGAAALADDDERPMIVCLHGLTGGSYESYLRAVLEPLIEAGWAACVVNSRGCAMSKVTTSILYNARATWDARQVIQWCRKTWPRRPLYGIGFSLGANMMTNYVGEEADKCILEAAVVCSNPWTLDVASIGLHRTFLGRELYSKTMGKNLLRVFEKHAHILKDNPRLNFEEVRKSKFIKDFDRTVQGPTWGYPTEGAYYRDASSTDALFGIRIPFLAINAEDDPISVTEAIPWREFEHNPYICLLSTAAGGHLSWFESGGTRWFAKPASRFLMKIADEVASVEKPSAKTEITSKSLRLDATAPTFCPTRHKLRMPAIDFTSADS